MTNILHDGVDSDRKCANNSGNRQEDIFEFKENYLSNQ